MSTARGTARRARWRPDGTAPRWAMSVTLLAGLASALGNLGSALTDSSWWFVAVCVATVTVVGTVIIRSITRFALLAQAGGFFLLLCALSFTFAPKDALLALIPTPAAFTVFAQLVSDGIASINAQSVPAQPVPGIVFLLTTGAALVAMVVDALAEVLGRPALVGVPLLAILLAPTFIAPGGGDPFFFCLTAAAYLIVLYLALGESRSGGAVGVGAVAVALALVVPIALPPVVDEDERSGPAGLTVNVNAFLDLGANLRQGKDVEVLTYVTDSGDGEYLRLTTIDDFEGDAWKPTPPQTYSGQTLAEIGDVPGLALNKTTERVRVAVSVGSMGGRWLPVPYAPRSVTDADENWSYEPATLTITSATESARGEVYEVVAERPTLAVDALEATGVRPGIGFRGASLDRYLALPSDLPDSVAETARAVAGAETNNFDKAIAIQDYFRLGDFTYSEQAPVQQAYDGTSAQAIALFLEAKQGYCVHFASAMAVMARVEGIPSRIVVGFTPGEYVGEKNGVAAHYSVTSHDMHAWPELWFDGFGWVRFEPTVSRGALPEFDASPTVDPTDAPTLAPTPAATQTPRATATPRPSSSASAIVPEAITTAPNLLLPVIVVGVLLIAVLVLLLLPFVPPLRRASRRFIRFWRVRRSGSARDAWAELVDTAVDMGFEVASATPRQLSDLIRRGAPEPERRALARLLAGIEATAFSPTAAHAAVDDVRLLRRYLLRRARRRERLRAFFAPQSVARPVPAKILRLRITPKTR